MNTETKPKVSGKLYVINSENIQKRVFEQVTVDVGVDEITIGVIEEVHYRHPDAPEYANIPILEERYITKMRRNDSDAAVFEMLALAQTAARVALRNHLTF